MKRLHSSRAGLVGLAVLAAFWFFLLGPVRRAVSEEAAAKPRAKVTYAKNVARILQQNCQTCHHPGTAAPFSLLTHEDAVKWADNIKEAITDGRMPPWLADPRWGHFTNDRRLKDADKSTLLAWIDSGTEPGDKKDLPPNPEYTEGWVIGKPDAIFEMPVEESVPASGVVPYQYYTTPTNFKEDMWVQSAEARPGNRNVVHHIIVSYRDPGHGNRGERGDGRGIGDGMLVGTAPGDMPVLLPSGVAIKIPAGAELIWQMHYTPNGKAAKDRSQVGLIFWKGKEPPKYRAQTVGIMNPRFTIPPGDAAYQVESEWTTPRDTVLFSYMPHMHLRGKDFKYEAIYPDGKSETLLSVPKYDFNWQLSYRAHQGVRLPKGTTIHCTAHFDNSAANKANPDPKQEVTWGDQTWEEMMIGWIGYMWQQPEPDAIREGFSAF
jgi:mono/diheme cytochrome c family protein